jgi:hypothetical protein
VRLSCMFSNDNAWNQAGSRLANAMTGEMASAQAAAYMTATELAPCA